MKAVCTIVLATILTFSAQAQQDMFSNGDVSIYLDYDQLYNEADEIEFSLMGSCELKGVMALRYVNRNGTDYDGPDFYEWNEGECYVSIDVPENGDRSPIKVEISGTCDCIAEDHRDSEFLHSDWLNAQMDMHMYGAEESDADLDPETFAQKVMGYMEQMQCYEDELGTEVLFYDMAMGEGYGYMEDISIETESGLVYYYFSLSYDMESDRTSVRAVQNIDGKFEAAKLSVTIKGGSISVGGFDYGPCE